MSEQYGSDTQRLPSAYDCVPTDCGDVRGVVGRERQLEATLATLIMQAQIDIQGLSSGGGNEDYTTRYMREHALDTACYDPEPHMVTLRGATVVAVQPDRLYVVAAKPSQLAKSLPPKVRAREGRTWRGWTFRYPFIVGLRLSELAGANECEPTEVIRNPNLADARERQMLEDYQSLHFGGSLRYTRNK